MKGTLAGLFSEIGDGDEIIRERTLKLLALKLKTMGPTILTKDVQDFLVSECKKVLQVLAFLVSCSRNNLITSELFF